MSVSRPEWAEGKHGAAGSSVGVSEIIVYLSVALTNSVARIEPSAFDSSTVSIETFIGPCKHLRYALATSWVYHTP